MKLALAMLIFSLTYWVISGYSIKGFPLNRATAVWLGAALMVACQIMTPEQAYATLHHGTLGLLLGMMVVNILLKRANFFQWAAWHVLRHAHSPTQLLHLTVWVAGGLSALLVNDTVCLMLTPLVIQVWRGAGLSLVPGLMALSMGANLGSAMTLTGNPQNMIIGQLSQIPFARYALLSVPSGMVGMGVVGMLLQLSFHQTLRKVPVRESVEKPVVDQKLLRLSLGVLAGMVLGFLAGFDLAWTSLLGAALLLPLSGQDPQSVLDEIDWSLLLFFSGLFVVMGGLGHGGVVALLGQLGAPLLQDGIGIIAALHLSWMTLLGSQVVSNVPWVLLVGPLMPQTLEPERMWLTLGLVSTFAGNLTLIGSVATLIVLEGARNEVQISFWQWFRLGLPATLLSSALGFILLFFLTSL